MIWYLKNSKQEKIQRGFEELWKSRENNLLLRPTNGIRGCQPFGTLIRYLWTGQDHGDPGSGRKVFGAKTVRHLSPREGKPPDLVGSRMTRNPKICWLFCSDAHVQCRGAMQVCTVEVCWFFWKKLLLSENCRQRFLEDQRWLAQVSRIGGPGNLPAIGRISSRASKTWKSQSFTGVIQTGVGSIVIFPPEVDDWNIEDPNFDSVIG